LVTRGAATQTAAVIVVLVWLLVCGEPGSLVAEVEAAFSTVAGAEPAVTTIVTMSLPPAGMSGRPVQVTVPADPEHTGVGETETKVTPAGSVSFTETPVAVAVAEGEFETVIV
jgi:hypothetical protein